MSGTGRPTYRNRKGKANPSASYMNTHHVMTRDLPSHLKIKLREKKVFDKEEILRRLEKLDHSKSLTTQDGAGTTEINESEDSDTDTETETSSAITSDTGDDDDEQASLMQELARMKQERQEEEERKIREAQEQIRNQFTANPLLDPEYSTKRKWTEESIFQNQALTAPVRKDKYVNDPIRSEYHQQFLRKYLKV